MKVPPADKDEALNRSNIKIEERLGGRLDYASPKKRHHEVEIERKRGKGPNSDYKLEDISMVILPKKKLKKSPTRRQSSHKNQGTTPEKKRSMSTRQFKRQYSPAGIRNNTNRLAPMTFSSSEDEQIEIS